MDSGEPRLVDCTGRGVRPDAGRTAARGARRAEQRGDAAYGALQQKYNIYQQVVQNNINYYLKEHPGAWLVYESGYKKLFGLSGTANVQDTLWAGLLCALCFSGLFAMERKGGMETVLRANCGKAIWRPS